MSLIRARYRAVNTIMNLPTNRFVGLLDLFPNAAAAYSLRLLRRAYSGAAVRVRRSSDNTEQDIGFTTQGELDTASLLSFVNADVNLFTSDYSSTGVAEPAGANFTTTINETKDGVDECLKAVWNGSSPSQLFKINFLPTSVGVQLTINAEFYLEGFTAVSMGANSNFGPDNATTNQWTTYSTTITVNGLTDDFTVFCKGGTSGSTIWLKNIVVTQTTADGHVSSWYDQSTNGNSATQSSATAQPKIVDAGSLIVDSNGFAEIKPDGINDYLEVNNTGIAIPDNSLVFSVSSYLDDADNVILSTVESTDYDNCLSIGNNFQGSNSGVCSVRLGGVTGVRGQYNESKSGYSANNKVLTNTLIKTAFADSDSIFNGNSADGNVSNRANVSDPGFFMFRAVGFYGTSPLNEVVVYDGSVSNQTANRTAAQSAIANFYEITLP